MIKLSLILSTAIAAIMGIVYANLPAVPDSRYKLEYEGAFMPPKLAPAVNIGTLHRIAVVDTGADMGTLRRLNVRMCETDQYDATTGKLGLSGDEYGHGTKMIYLAARAASKTNYCIISVKIFSGIAADSSEDIIGRAFKHLKRIKKVDVISLSWTGPGFRFTEFSLLSDLTKKGIRVFAAAGNRGEDLTQSCSTYPACYNIKGLEAVGALSPESGKKAHYSNFGTKVSLWFPGFFEGERGTSVATAIASGTYAGFLGGHEQVSK